MHLLTSTNSEGPREPNYFLESRNIVPLRSEFKPPPVLLSRKGPPIIQSRRPPTDALSALDLDRKAADSSEDEDEVKAREKTLAERQAQAAKDREVKQRKYEERRQELFGTPSAPNSGGGNVRPTSRSGGSTPNSNTPPGSRSATPSRGGRGRGRGRGGREGANQSQARNQHRQQQQQQSQQELYDPGYAPLPESVHPLRRESPQNRTPTPKLEQPIRAPKGPDGSGRGGFGFAARGGGKVGGEQQP